MENKDEIEETKINLIGMLIFSVFLFGGGMYTQSKLKLDIEKGIIWNEPILHRMSKSTEIIFTIKNAPGFSHKIRSIYRDLDQHQKAKILNLKRGTPIEIHVNNHRTYQNKKEIYAIKIKEEWVYSIDEYEALKHRELVGGIWMTVLFLFLIFIYTKSKWKEIGCLVYLLAVIGMALVLLVFYR